ncbi:MAG: hypothetical protein OCD02_10345 [Spirochaetaceae bacterium]
MKTSIFKRKNIYKVLVIMSKKTFGISSHQILLIIMIMIVSTIEGEEKVKLESGKTAILYDDKTWAIMDFNDLSINDLNSKNKSKLRKNIEATESEIVIACEMFEQGWLYTMPTPKSSKAVWEIRR